MTAPATFQNAVQRMAAELLAGSPFIRLNDLVPNRNQRRRAMRALERAGFIVEYAVLDSRRCIVVRKVGTL